METQKPPGLVARWAEGCTTSRGESQANAKKAVGIARWVAAGISQRVAELLVEYVARWALGTSRGWHPKQFGFMARAIRHIPTPQPAHIKELFHIATLYAHKAVDYRSGMLREQKRKSSMPCRLPECRKAKRTYSVSRVRTKRLHLKQIHHSRGP